MKIVWNVILILILMGCDPKPVPVKLNKFQDLDLQKIYTYQYNRDAKALIPYLKHTKTEYRAEAALSFSSIQDSTYLAELYPLLCDPDIQVRIFTAFAIGQTRAVGSAPQLMEAIEKEPLAAVRRFMLEALGRISTPDGLLFLTNFEAKEEPDRIGQAWGIYRCGLAGRTSEAGTTLMTNYANVTFSDEIKLAAGHYLYRMRIANPMVEQLSILLALSHENPEIRMVFARVLGSHHTIPARDALLKILKTDSVYNVRVDAVNALSQHSAIGVKEAVWRSVLTDQHISVRIAASEYFKKATKAPDFILLNQVDMLKNWRVRSNMLTAFMKGAATGKAKERIKTRLTRSENKYEKEALLHALLSNGENVLYVADYLKNEKDGDIILSAAYDLDELLRNQTLEPAAFSDMLGNWLTTDNPYLIRQAAHFMCKPDIDLTISVTQDQLQQVLKRMNRTKDTTVVFALKLAIAKLKNVGMKNTTWDPEFFIEPAEFRTFNWNKIVIIPNDLNIKVMTEKGEFTLQMLVEDAPFTVAHFIELIKADFFEGMPFYRVIPNFVNQTGGARIPAFDAMSAVRIRSELALKWHRTATVNMASYGHDTESSHFSIMLCPTPWNDNNYTIFAKVIDNMQVVQNLELGDKIYGMEILTRYKL